MKHLRKFATLADRESYMANNALPDLPYVHYIESTKDIFFSSPEIDVPLYIKAVENLSVKFSNNYEYSKDNITWTSATSSTSISVNKGEMVFFRAAGLVASSSSGIGAFTISSGKCNVGGNIMSMAYGANYKGQTEITQEYQFYKLFNSSYTTTNNGVYIIDASALALPATKLTSYCYSYMFNNCASLVNAPALPATTLETNCYAYMFYKCTSLVAAPSLPATTLAQYCYSNMFYGCSSLISAPALRATILAEYAYYYMFYGCSSLVAAPSLPATSLAKSCYRYMFSGCTSLVTAPSLPATTLAQYCYQYMFRGCASLVTAPSLPATTLDSYCYAYMFTDCTSLVNAPALPATTLKANCYTSMFSNCTSLVNAPALPATTLVSQCYRYMFSGCASLSYIKAMFKTTPTTTNAGGWVKGVASSGIFVKNSAATWNVVGENGVPEGWTIETAEA